jgi:hypothetical protein
MPAAYPTSLLVPCLDGAAENARVKELMRLDAEAFRAELQANPEFQAIDPRLAPLAGRIGRLIWRQRRGYSPTRATQIVELTTQYDAIRGTEAAC